MYNKKKPNQPVTSTNEGELIDISSDDDDEGTRDSAGETSKKDETGEFSQIVLNAKRLSHYTDSLFLFFQFTQMKRTALQSQKLIRCQAKDPI